MDTHTHLPAAIIFSFDVEFNLSIKMPSASYIFHIHKLHTSHISTTQNTDTHTQTFTYSLTSLDQPSKKKTPSLPIIPHSADVLLTHNRSQQSSNTSSHTHT